MQFIRHNVLWCIHLSMIEYWTRLYALNDTTVCMRQTLYCPRVRSLIRLFVRWFVHSFVCPSVRLRALACSLSISPSLHEWARACSLFRLFFYIFLRLCLFYSRVRVLSLSAFSRFFFLFRSPVVSVSFRFTHLSFVRDKTLHT